MLRSHAPRTIPLPGWGSRYHVGILGATRTPIRSLQLFPAFESFYDHSDINTQLTRSISLK